MIGTWSRPFRFFYRLYLPIFERIGYKKNAKSLLCIFRPKVGQDSDHSRPGFRSKVGQDLLRLFRSI